MKNKPNYDGDVILAIVQASVIVTLLTIAIVITALTQ